MADSDVNRRAGKLGLTDTPDADKNFGTRVTNVITYDTGHSVEAPDITKMIIDPNSNLVKSQAMAMARTYDDLIIGAAQGAAQVKGKGAAVVLPASQIIADPTKTITFDHITAITEKFLENDVELDQERVIIVSPAQARQLLHISQATGREYDAASVLATKGLVENWMGYDFIVSTRLAKYKSTNFGTGAIAQAAGTTNVIAMTKSALGFHASQPLSTQVAKDPSKSFAWRTYSSMTCDAVRVEDKQVVVLQVKNQA